MSANEHSHPHLHPYGPARILAYICRPKPPPSPPSTPSASLSSASSIYSSPSSSSDLYPELEILDHPLPAHLPFLPATNNPIHALERAVSAAVSRHRYCYYDDYPNLRSFPSSASPDAAALASTEVRASDIRLSLRSGIAPEEPPRPTVFGSLRLYTSWMRPLSAMGKDEFRGVLRCISRHREVAEIVVLLRPAVARDDDLQESMSIPSYTSSDTASLGENDDDVESPCSQSNHLE
ncbi:hypothetical protein PG994_000908 [Apiospora phragmitis]|uniref:Uncharacterized protein n=1 Tax=Apiospora phragmitis TaxID=2905665 RepID=A0ABR1WQW7_9PEZI